MLETLVRRQNNGRQQLKAANRFNPCDWSLRGRSCWLESPLSYPPIQAWSCRRDRLSLKKPNNLRAPVSAWNPAAANGQVFLCHLVNHSLLNNSPHHFCIPQSSGQYPKEQAKLWERLALTCGTNISDNDSRRSVHTLILLSLALIEQRGQWCWPEPAVNHPHLEKIELVRLVFMDLSCTLNTVQPHLLGQKTLQIDFNPYPIIWILSLLPHRH